MPETIHDLVARAAALDAADPLSEHVDSFLQIGDVRAYLDGNSLGRPLRATRDSLTDFVENAWAARLIRGWDEGWFASPTELGDTIARVALGAAPGQTVVADSTTVLLYKLTRAAVDARPGRDEVVLDADNFPTDRFVLEGVAAERGLTLRWAEGATVEQVAPLLGERTALVLLSHVDYRSARIADLPAITGLAHAAGALVLWDLCHSVGVVDVQLDRHSVDLAVGCTYKYLNGGPGSPAFGYVASRHHGELAQPIQGWMGATDPFAMADRYEPAAGVRQLVSGTPPVSAMVPMRDMLALVEQVGISAIREKSVALTEFAIQVHDALLAPLGVSLASPREAATRGGHVTLEHPDCRRVVAALWEQGVIPDFRPPSGLRVGLSPLSTSFREVLTGLRAAADELG